MKKLATMLMLAGLLQPVVASDDLKLLREIYGEIQVAIGDQQIQWPEIEIWDRVRNVAGFRPGDNLIVFEKQALEICKTFGEARNAAIAYLLGHELTHFYQRHQWGERGFGSSFLLNESDFSEFQIHEREADLYGAFLAYVSGHDVRGILPKLLEGIYVSYGIGEGASQTYPSLAERQQAALQVRDEVDRLVDVYECAHLFSAIGQYYLSALSYQYILKYIRTKGLYHNTALAYLKAGLQSMSSGAGRYEFPIAIERQLPVRGIDIFDPREVLELAEEYFTSSINLDKTYHHAILGLATTKIAAGDFETSIGLLDELSIDRTGKEQAELLIVRGNLAALMGDETAATRYWEAAKSYHRDKLIVRMADHNEGILRGVKPGTTSRNTYKSIPWKISSTEGVSTSVSLPDTDPLYNFELNLSRDKFSRQAFFEHSGLEVELSQILDPELAHDFPLKIGDSVLEVTEHFDGKSSLYNHSLGYYLMLREQQIILDIQAGKIHSITAFTVRSF